MLRRISNCEICSDEDTKPRLLVPRSKGGSGCNRANLIWLCSVCFNNARVITFQERDREIELERLWSKDYLTARLRLTHPGLSNIYLARLRKDRNLMVAIRFILWRCRKHGGDSHASMRAVRYLYLSEMLHTPKRLVFKESDYANIDDLLENLP